MVVSKLDNYKLFFCIFVFEASFCSFSENVSSKYWAYLVQRQRFLSYLAGEALLVHQSWLAAFLPKGLNQNRKHCLSKVFVPTRVTWSPSDQLVSPDWLYMRSRMAAVPPVLITMFLAVVFLEKVSRFQSEPAMSKTTKHLVNICNH